MAMNSMTGHGSGAAASRSLRVEVELGSVNRRQLDVRLSLSKPLAALEPRIHELVHRRVARGNVSGIVRVTDLNSSGRRVHFNVDAAREHVKGLRKAARELGVEDDITARALLSLPDIIRYDTPADDPETVWPLLERALKQALGGLVGMRREEGKALQEDLSRRIEKLAARRDRIAGLAPRVAERYRTRLAARLKEAGLNVSGAEPELMREVALLADRSDIAEELTRLDSHLKQAASKIRKGGRVGRTLDFICQELLREINTVGSKAGDAAISGQVIHFKAELERVREQVQNVE